MGTTDTTTTGPGLPRVLGPWMATALVIGTVIGSGIFFKQPVVAKAVPYFGLAILAWVLVGVLALIGGLALAEVAVLLPRAGGNYVFLREGYGRWAGFMWGWVEFWIIRSASIAALATAFTNMLHDLLRHARDLEPHESVLAFWEERAITIGVIGVLGWVNLRGTRLSGGVQLAITTVKVGSVLAIILLPFVIAGLVSTPRAQPDSANLAPVWPVDWTTVSWTGFGAAFVSILWPYHGWMNIAPAAGEVREPGRNIPLALLIGTLTVMALYVSVNVSYALVIPHDDMILLKDRNVAGELCRRLLGPTGLMLASVVVMISVFGALNGNLLVGPRLLYAMAHDRLAPRSLGELHPRFQTPAAATLVLTCWSILLVVGSAILILNRDKVGLPEGANPFDLLTDYAMFGAISFETLAVASIFALRRRYPLGQVVSYRCWGYPWLPALYVAAWTAVLVNMFYTRPTEALLGLGFIAVGAAVYAGTFAGRGPDLTTAVTAAGE